MILVEETTPAEAALPVAAFRAHLRLGSGFDLPADEEETRALTGFLRAAIATIEGRTGKVLLRGIWRMTLDDWRDEYGQSLPMAPVSEVQSIEIETADGTLHPVPAERWRLSPDAARPVIRPRSGSLPSVPQNGQLVIRFVAGFGESWAQVPADLAQAVMMLATRYYEDRSDDHARHVLPMGVSALIERWRAVRVLAGRTR